MSGAANEAAGGTAGVAGRVALVTGGGQGIGAATVRRLAAGGAPVASLDLDEQRAAAPLAGLAGDTLALGCDVTDRDQVDAAVARTVERFGRLDILVSNAGVTRDNLLFKMSDEDWQTVIATHLSGGFYCARAAQAAMVRERYGRIVFLSSRSALGNRGQANYAAAKAGLQGLTRTLALELGPFGITVNAVAPGFIETPMTRAMVERTGTSWEELTRAAAERAAVKRTGRPADVAEAITYLASAEAGFVTGQTLYVTGSPAG
jgi:3-oxoacyl-[acyl-carrier protein] reductase